MKKEFSVLIVDDCRVMRSVIQKTLDIIGIEIGRIDTAGNGFEGMELIYENHYDLIILDMNMPKMDGMEMLSEIRKNFNRAEIPVLVVSTESNKDRIDAILKMGCRFVHKPFTPETLKEEIEEFTRAEVK